MKKIRRSLVKAQSAMEYLMTYGWAILIIAVVLGALFSLGLFSGSSLTGTACIATPGWYCQSPVLSHGTSLLGFNIGQNTGTAYANVIVACAATSNSATGFPYITGTAPTNTIQSGTSATYAGWESLGTATNTFPGATLNSGSIITLGTAAAATTGSGLQCYGSGGTAISASSVGAAFSGSIWVAYNTSGTSTGAINAVSKFATISVKST